MYIQSVHIQNIKAIEDFRMEFPENPAGWHVVIGDNGAGKTGLLQAIALGLVGVNSFLKFRYPKNFLIRKGQKHSEVTLLLDSGREDHTVSDEVKVVIKLNQVANEPLIIPLTATPDASDVFWRLVHGRFSASFGPFRRLKGGNPDNHKLFEDDPRAAAHFSLFETEFSFIKVEDWLRNYYIKKLKNPESQEALFLESLCAFLNQDDLLPHGYHVVEVNENGLVVMDENSERFSIDSLSDGFRSILALSLELIRQMSDIFFVKDKEPFFEAKNSQLVITKSGVVLIDEIDAHLHPTWQTRIGQWFTSFFPNIQFIVTTHSPLICRAAEKGIIWRLAAPGLEQESGELKGVVRDRLIYGNVLDAFGTEAFGQNVGMGASGSQKRQRLAELNQKSIEGDEMSAEEEAEYRQLQRILPT